MARRKTLIEEDQANKPDPTLAIIVAQLEQIAAQQRLIFASQEALKVEVDDKLATMYRQMIAEKEAATQGLQAAMETWEEAIKHNVMSKEELQRQLELTREQAEKVNAVKREKFREHLATAPKGTIASFHPGVVELQINGVRVNIKPGLNKNIPQPFIEAWEDHTESSAVAHQRNNLIADTVLEGGLMDDWRSAGRQGSISEIPIDGQ